MREKKKEKEGAREMRAEGMTIPNIAKQLGVALSSVSAWVKDVELTKEQRGKIKKTRYNRGLATKKDKGLYQPYPTATLPWFDALNTKAKGNISVLNVMTALIKRGNTISIPFGDNERYDFIWDNKGKLERVQVKTGRLRDGSVQFRTISMSEYYKPGYHPKDYGGQIEYFGVHCPENNKCYLIPIEDCTTKNISLRIEPTRNGQHKRVRWASDYEMK
jgi:hypothetical protein